MDDMPGPTFDQQKGNNGWFKRNGQKIVLSLIVVLLAVGGYYFYKNYQERRAILQPIIEQTNPSPSGSPFVANPTASPKVTSANTQGAVIPEVKKENTDFVATAAKGDGATHLARQSLKEFLKEKPDLAGKLKAEHKIYIEDYLQKHTTHANVLKIGDKITFSQDLMNEAIDHAQKLTDNQVNNLHQYVLLVPSLQNG
jgi:hypothetical protein